MNNKLPFLLSIALLLTYALPASGQSPDGLVGCLDANGTLFNVFPKGTLIEPCPAQTTTVQLGSLSGVETGTGLVSKIEAGNALIDVDPDFAIPPACPAGQVALADGNGGWVCTPPNLIGKKNPASNVWVVPLVHRCVNNDWDSGDRPRLLVFCGGTNSATFMTIVNPGLQATSVSCLFFSQRGVLQLDQTQTVTISSGAQGSCFSPPLDHGSTRTYAWSLIVAERPVLPTVRAYGEAQVEIKKKGEASINGAQVEAYPVDCSEPEDHEFVCQFAN